MAARPSALIGLLCLYCVLCWIVVPLTGMDSFVDKIIQYPAKEQVEL